MTLEKGMIKSLIDKNQHNLPFMTKLPRFIIGAFIGLLSGDIDLSQHWLR